MGSLILLHPGELGPLVGLNDVLEAHHEERRAERDREIAERNAGNAPLDDTIDWGATFPSAVIQAINTRDSAALRAAAKALHDATAGLLEPFEPYVRDPRLEGVRLQCVVLSEKRRRELARDEGKVLKRLRDALAAKDDSAAFVANEAVINYRRENVKEIVLRVEVGDKVLDPVSEGALDALERSGILFPLYVAAHAEQSLSPGKASRSGSSAESTSSASSARDAPRIDGPSSAATAAATSPTRTLDGQPAPALGGT